MSAVVESNAENLNRVQGGEEFADLDFPASRLETTQEVALQLQGGAVRS